MSALDDFLASKAVPSNTATLPTPQERGNSAIDSFLSSRSNTPKPLVDTVPNQPVENNQPTSAPYSQILRRLSTPAPQISNAQISAPAPTFLDRPSFLANAINAGKDIFSSASKSVVDLSKAIAPSGEFNPSTGQWEALKVSPADRGIAMVRASIGVAQLHPEWVGVSALLKGVEGIQPSSNPIANLGISSLKQGAKNLDTLGHKAYQGAGNVVGAGIDKFLPQNETAQKFKPVAQELAGFLSIVALGKISHEMMKAPEAISNKIGEIKDTNGIVNQAKEVLSIPVEKDLLQRSKQVSTEDVNKAYRRAAQITHPDKGGTPEEFQVVSTAKTILQDHVEMTPKEFNAKWQEPLKEVQKGIKGYLEDTTPKEEPKQSAVDAFLKEKSPIEKMQETSKQNTSDIQKQTLAGQREEFRLDKQPKIDLLKDYVGENATPDTVVKVYRAGTGDIKTGEQVTLSEANANKYVQQRPGSKVISTEIPLKDLVHNNGLRHEFVYSPTEINPKIALPTTSPSKVGKSVETKSIEKGLTESFGGTAQYTPVTIKEQAGKASDLLSADIEKAKRIVRGEEPLPEGLLGGTLIKAMEDHALETKDTQLALDIANSPLTSATSEHAQEMRMLAERNPDSVVANLEKVKQIKEGSNRNNAVKKAKVVKEIQESIKEAKSKQTKETWNSFIDSIIC